MKILVTSLLSLGLLGSAYGQSGTVQEPKKQKGALPKPKKEAARPKVTICHVEKGRRRTLRVDQTAVSGHMAHGDVQGACGAGG